VKGLRDEPVANFGDYIWLIIITVLTIGYGDIYPVTTSGRVVALFSSLCGLIWTATLIGVINNSLDLRQNEKAALIYLEQSNQYKRFREVSARIIGLTWKVYRTRKHRDTVRDQVRLNYYQGKLR